MFPLTLVDLGLILVVLLAARTGWRQGGTALAGRIAGLLVGLVAGSALALAVAPWGASWGVRLLLIAGAFVLAVVVGSSLGGRLGAFVGAGLHRAGLGPIDSAGGAVVRGGLALVACWLLAAVMLAYGSPAVGSAVANSTLLSALDRAMPEPRSTVTELSRLMSTNEVQTELGTRPGTLPGR